MKNAIPRRTFLRGAGAAVATGSGLFGADKGSAEASLPLGGAAAAAGGSRLFAGCCAYSFRKYLEHGPMTMEDFILKGVELGLHGVDMTVYYLKSTDPAYLTGLRHVAFKNGMPFSGAACGSSMVQADKAKRAQVLADIKKWVDVTDWLGASHLRIFAGELPPGATVDQGMEWSVEVMKPACDYAGTKGMACELVIFESSMLGNLADQDDFGVKRLAQYGVDFTQVVAQHRLKQGDCYGRRRIGHK